MKNDSPPSLGFSSEDRPKPSLPLQISTGCGELDLVWTNYSQMIFGRSQILIPDTDEDLTWHAFLGHSIDMQGFRAAEFAGIDPLTRRSPDFISLKDRRLGVPELAALWNIAPIQHHLLTGTKGVPLQVSLDKLRSEGGATGNSLAEAFESFPWRRFHWSVRALLQNSAVLTNHAYSFRRFLQDECAQLGVVEFPPADFQQLVELAGVTTTVERALRTRLEKSFYMVGPAMSAYMICDWQLWLWREGRTCVFATFKLDSFHEEFVKRYGRDVVPGDESGFTRWWFSMYPNLPPRLANECIWLGIEHKVI